MDKFEERRLALQQLIEGMGRGGIARVAERIGKEPNYVSRMLYPQGKPGKKRIGEDSVDALNAAFPGWMSAAPGSDEVQELSSVVARLTSSGKMQPTELHNLIAMLKAREGSDTP